MADEDDEQSLTIPPEDALKPGNDTWSDCLTTEASIDLILPDRAKNASFLRQVNGPGAPKDYVFTRDRLVLGRSKAADITIESPELSRKHVEAVRDGQEFLLSDLDSRNGLYLNGIQIHSCVLRHGDTIQIGNVTFVFYEGH